MKKMLRKWLGITDLEKRIPEPITQEQLRGEIEQAFSDALDGKEDETWVRIYAFSHIPTKLQRALRDASKETAKNEARECINERIDNESFIDEIVDRIKRKQIL